jgi:hypothetical protein
MSKQQKFEKKKARERAVQQKLRVRRDSKQKQDKEVREEAKETASYKKMVNQRVKLEQWVKAAEGKIPEELEDRMRHNIEILKALEEEHVAELNARAEAREQAARDLAAREKESKDNGEAEAWKSLSEASLSEKISLDAQVG